MEFKKILFIVRKSSENAYKECINSIDALKIPLRCSIGYASYDANDTFQPLDVYLAMYQSESPDISIIVDDTVLFVYEDLLNDLIKVFQSDSSIRLIGVKGVREFPDSGIINDAENIYGGLYEMNNQREVFEKRYTDISEAYAQVEAVSSTVLVIRGYIPVWAGVNGRCIGEVMSVAAEVYGYKAVIPRNARFWCFSTLPEAKPTAEDVAFIKGKYRFKRILFNRNHYLLTIGIPTFNRSKYLAKCLSNLCTQTSNLPWIEIFVSDNASTDDTEKIIARCYGGGNFRYHKQFANIGAGKNFEYIYENARGDFVIACGDDDYYTGEAILNLLEAICLYPDVTVMELEWRYDHVASAILHNIGFDNFLVECTELYTCISCVALNKERYMEVSCKDRFAHTQLNQCYIQLEMIRHAPGYVLIKGNNFSRASGEASRGRIFSRDEQQAFCDIFIREYYSVVEYFLDKGLSRNAFEKEKIINIRKIFTWLHHIKQTGHLSQWRIDDDLDVLIEEFYGYEPYYDRLKQEVAILKR